MSASIDLRVRFLDDRIVESAIALLLEFKMCRETAGSLKQVARRQLPGDVVKRCRSGCGVSLIEWLADVLGLGTIRGVACDSAELPPVAHKEAVARHVNEYRGGDTNHCEPLLTVVNPAPWSRIPVNRCSAKPPIGVRRPVG